MLWWKHFLAKSWRGSGVWRSWHIAALYNTFFIVQEKSNREDAERPVPPENYAFLLTKMPWPQTVKDTTQLFQPEIYNAISCGQKVHAYNKCLLIRLITLCSFLIVQNCVYSRLRCNAISLLPHWVEIVNGSICLKELSLKAVSKLLWIFCYDNQNALPRIWKVAGMYGTRMYSKLQSRCD